eukprot:gene28463-34360_t
MAVTRSKAARAAEAAMNRHPQAVEAFKEGIGSVLRQWTALELAVFHQWGGPTSKERAEALQKEIMDMYLGPDKIYKDDISLVLEDYLETNFNTICEDGSPDELGELFCTMWRQCCAGDFSTVSNVLAKEYVRHEMVTKSQGLDTGGDIIEEDDDEDETGGHDGDNQDAVNRQMSEIARQVVQQQAAAAGAGEGMMEAIEEETAPPLVDPDGWETVTSKRKTNKKSKSYKI